MIGTSMGSSIIIDGIQLNARCGTTESESCQPQPLVIDLVFRCPNALAFQSDRLEDTVDYAKVRQCVRQSGESRTFALLETLAEHICHTLFQKFPITEIKISVRKVRPPIKDFTGSVGIRLHRARGEMSHEPSNHPSPFLMSQLSRLPRGNALDVATGRGRNAHFLAAQGYSVHGIDHDDEALTLLMDQARETNLSSITTQHVELEPASQQPPDLGTESYDLILVFFYLHRPLFPSLLKALKPGGMIIYETFLIDNHVYRQHPRRKEFCLRHNELLELLQNLRIVHYDEGAHTGRHYSDRVFTVQATACKS